MSWFMVQKGLYSGLVPLLHQVNSQADIASWWVMCDRGEQIYSWEPESRKGQRRANQGQDLPTLQSHTCCHPLPSARLSSSTPIPRPSQLLIHQEMGPLRGDSSLSNPPGKYHQLGTRPSAHQPFEGDIPYSIRSLHLWSIYGNC